MKLNRGWWVAFVLAPAAVLGGAPTAAHAQESDPGAAPLPPRVHYAGGRYSIDLCDHADPGYCLTHRLLPESYRPDVNGPLFDGPLAGPAATWMTPTDILKAYSIPTASSGAGRVVAIVDAPDADAFSDLTLYRSGFKLPALPKCTGSGLPDGKTPCFAQVSETGQANFTSEDCGGEYDGETGLDMDMISAACPDCAILLVQVTSWFASKGTCKITDANFGTGLHSAAVEAIKLGAAAVSMSFGSPEGGTEPTGYTTAGHLVLAASGDTGYDLGDKSPGTGSYPATAPDILGVGGTNLAVSGSTYTETVWNNDIGASGSGCSKAFAFPAFQSAYLKANPGAFGICTKRASADVSAAASFGPGTGGTRTDGIASVSGGTWQNVWGTSAASPMVAAIFTRMNVTDKISADLGEVYTNPTAFNDVTSGDNSTSKDSCTGVVCNAAKGWDGPSGMGSPNGEKLMTLAGGSSSGSGSSSGGKKGDGGAGSSSSGGKKGSSSSGSSSGGSGSSGGSSGGESSSGGVEVDASASSSGSSSGSGSGTDNDLGPGGGGGSGCSMGSPTGTQATSLFALGGLALVLSSRRKRR